MKLYEVTNGYHVNNVSVKVFVIAKSCEQAAKLARDKFFDDAVATELKHFYPSNYWTKLNVERIICRNTKHKWVSEVQYH